MWDVFNKQYQQEVSKSKEPESNEHKLPDWLEKYIEYKFNLLDRTGELVQSVCIF